MMSLFTFISPVASSMVAPAAFQIAEELDITQSIEVSMTISVYVLAYGTSPELLSSTHVLRLSRADVTLSGDVC